MAVWRTNLEEITTMALVINTNVLSLNAQRNLTTSQSALGDGAPAIVIRFAHQQRERRRRGSGDLATVSRRRFAA